MTHRMVRQEAEHKIFVPEATDLNMDVSHTVLQNLDANKNNKIFIFSRRHCNYAWSCLL